MKETKEGRLRRFDMKPDPGAADATIGYYIAVFDELSERVFDQISDLPAEALSFVPEGSYLSIGKLVLHQALDEAQMVARMAGAQVPPDLAEALGGADRKGLSVPLDPPPTAAELIAICRRVREEMTRPLLGPLTDPDAPVDVDHGPDTVRRMLMHLVWHWIYHSGHIGLTRLLWGSDYNWRY
jgi:uncharacterized damage-inducible protein DinB